MPCDHKGGPELIEMAEEHLRRTSVPPSDWDGLRFRWAENPAEGYFAAVIVEIERRGEQWVVTRLDRFRDPLPEAEVGFRNL